jgi:hypothetical protein
MCNKWISDKRRYKRKRQNRPKSGWKKKNLTSPAADSSTVEQGCQMVYFQTKNTNLVKFWRMGKCWYILWSFRIFYRHLGYLMTIWYILCSFGTVFSGFGIMYQEKSGNPAVERDIRIADNWRNRTVGWRHLPNWKSGATHNMYRSAGAFVLALQSSKQWSAIC